jgi:hypothetical protein
VRPDRILSRRRSCGCARAAVVSCAADQASRTWHPESLDFSLLDLVTGNSGPLTSLSNKGSIRGFNITPDGKDILFDLAWQNS